MPASSTAIKVAPSRTRSPDENPESLLLAAVVNHQNGQEQRHNCENHHRVHVRNIPRHPTHSALPPIVLQSKTGENSKTSACSTFWTQGRLLHRAKDDFKSLWTRFKAKSDLVSPMQTLYSFRHTAAIALLEKTGSVTKLSRAMDHSSLEVTLGYLRNLGRTELTADDMPSL